MSTLKPYQTRILYLLTRQELLIAEIYRFFAGLYPDHREFWNDAAKEEMEHATWVEYLYKKAAAGEIRFDEGKTRTYTVESFVKYLEENLARVKERAFLPPAAFALAVNIENSLLARGVFDLFEGADAESRSLLLDLREKLKEHRRRIRDAAREATLVPAAT